MKKITLFAVALIAVSFDSCTKTHTCKCSDTAGNSYTRELPKQTSSQAKSTCDAYASTGVTCTIQ
jgi:hypothetical protein